MKGWDNDLYIILMIVSNGAALLMILFAMKWPRIGRLSFFILFMWAGFTNWKVSQQTPHFYLDYAGLTWNNLYHKFITGWFANHIQLAVSFIASCQALIAISMLFKAWLFRTGAIGAIVFLLAIAPLGIGSGFPCTIILAVAMLVLIRNHDNHLLWERGTVKKQVS